MEQECVRSLRIFSFLIAQDELDAESFGADTNVLSDDPFDSAHGRHAECVLLLRPDTMSVLML
jgi:hypothetical protein